MLATAILALQLQNAPARPATAGAIQGIVLKSGTVEGLGKATIELRPDVDPLSMPAGIPPVLASVLAAPPVATTTTDGDGRFVFPNVRAGRYRIAATRSGYGQRVVVVDVAGGRTASMQIALSGTGAIAGRVYGQNGEALGNVIVEALRPSFQNGQRILTPVQSVHSDDRGEYRLFWLPPGRYFIRAFHPDAENGPMGLRMGSFAGRYGGTISVGGGGPGPNGLFANRATGDPGLFDAFGPGDAEKQVDRYIAVYFPGTTIDGEASAIDIAAGSEANGIDIRISPVRQRQVRGAVINGTTGQIAEYGGLRIVDAGAVAGDPVSLDRMGAGPMGEGRALIDPNGTFDIALLPGRYVLIGTAGSGTGYTAIDVRDADLDGIRVVAMPPFDIMGRVTIEGQAAEADLATMRISLRREGATAAPSTSYSVLRADRTFVVSATPGDYRLNIAPLLNLGGIGGGPIVRLPQRLENAYVKAVTLGNVDVLNGGVRLEGPPPGQIEVVIGLNPGGVDGTLADNGQPGQPGTTIVLLPNNRGRFDLLKTASTDPAGRFHFNGVPPGEYKVFAWQDVPEDAWQDPDFVRRYEDRGTAIRVVEGGRIEVRVTAIIGQ